ncbi:hypothetical protein POTOM_046731 [Populus tomentosa]|uniref:Uncharacterized protein n=1 Tax=Populus tomentosa TaxID=118781 RepID=A0A8X7YR57_POPTO|nr:hypothetical protein POTOM_046731 [Populus tomentosa]
MTSSFVPPSKSIARPFKLDHPPKELTKLYALNFAESKEHIRHQRSPPDLDCALHHLPAVPQLKRLVSRLWNEAAHGRGLFLLCSPKLVRPPVERQK